MKLPSLTGVLLAAFVNQAEAATPDGTNYSGAADLLSPDNLKEKNCSIETAKGPADLKATLDIFNQAMVGAAEITPAERSAYVQIEAKKFLEERKKAFDIHHDFLVKGLAAYETTAATDGVYTPGIRIQDITFERQLDLEQILELRVTVLEEVIDLINHHEEFTPNDHAIYQQSIDPAYTTLASNGVNCKRSTPSGFRAAYSVGSLLSPTQVELVDIPMSRARTLYTGSQLVEAVRLRLEAVEENYAQVLTAFRTKYALPLQ